MDIKVSILVPVYNSEKTLKRCIDSVLSQTLKEIEIIITNDGSTDNSEKIIKNYLKESKRIVYINQQNSGLGATRNSGIEKAKGNYIAFLDSDDWVDDNYYEKMYHCAITTNSDIVVSSYRVEGLKKTNSHYKEFNYNSKKEYLLDLLKDNIAGFSWNKLYKKELIEKNNLRFPLREELENVEDQYFSIRSIYYANQISFMNESNIHYFVNSQSIVQKYQPTLMKDIVTLYRKNCEFFAEDPYRYEKINAMKYQLKKSIINIINNEFKSTRNVHKKIKISKIKKIIEYPEFIEVINDKKMIDRSLFNKLYFYLMKHRKFNILYLVAYMRCKKIKNLIK